MRILVAPDKFKECLPAMEVARAITAGCHRAAPDGVVDLCPVADGGEGTVAALVAATKGSLHTRRVTGPLPSMQVDATFGMLGDGTTAVVEMSAASGLQLLSPHQRNPFNTTTYGTGELLMAAAEVGARKIILGIGGSATIDAGIGCAQACGWIIETENGASAARKLCGSDLPFVTRISRPAENFLNEVEIVVACDVTNPLFGPAGAAKVFGPQKGASPGQVIQLDDWLAEFAERMGMLNIANQPCAGAAGGLGFAMLAFFGATLRPGIEIVLDAVEFRQRLQGADLCITGEGHLDAQTIHGKAVSGVALACREAGVPCVALVGKMSADDKAIRSCGLTRAYSISEGLIDPNESFWRARELLAQWVEKIVSEIASSR